MVGLVGPPDEGTAEDPTPRMWAWITRHGHGADQATKAWEPVVQRVQGWRSCPRRPLLSKRWRIGLVVSTVPPGVWIALSHIL